MVKRVILSAALLMGMAIQPAMAQDIQFDASDVATACAAGDCQAAVLRAIASLRALGLTPAQLNAQLSVLAAVTLEAVANAPAAVRAEAALAMASIAAASTDSRQAEAIRTAAAQIAAGTITNPTAVASSFSAA